MNAPEAVNPTILNHALAAVRLTTLRNRETDVAGFRRALHEVGLLLAAEALRDLPTQPVRVDTPNEPATGAQLAKPVALVPVLRAGQGLVEPFLEVLPEASVCYIGLARDEETLRPKCYLLRIPSDLSKFRVLVLDPMLATGHSACHALEKLKERGAVDLHLVCLLAAPEGVRQVLGAHPGLPILCAALDRELDQRGFILPGLGDAGDRQFGC